MPTGFANVIFSDVRDCPLTNHLSARKTSALQTIHCQSQSLPKGSYTIVKAIINFYFRYTMKLLPMKNLLVAVALIGFMSIVCSCNLFKPKYGCPTNGKNIGAEKLASGDPQAEKAARKAKKFRS
jgi:hypothetical protein